MLGVIPYVDPVYQRTNLWNYFKEAICTLGNMGLRRTDYQAVYTYRICLTNFVSYPNDIWSKGCVYTPSVHGVGSKQTRVSGVREGCGTVIRGDRLVYIVPQHSTIYAALNVEF